MKSPTCPRLSRQVSRYARIYTHLDDEAITRLIREHSCPDCPGAWRPTPGLPRDLDQTTREKR